MRAGVFKRPPRAKDVCEVREAGVKALAWAPRVIISDKGRQFTGREYTAWCLRHGVEARYGAVGKHGSIAVVERFIKSLKDECLRRILAPLALSEMKAEVAFDLAWYTHHRPHSSLRGGEVLAGLFPACDAVGIELCPHHPLRRIRWAPRRRRRTRAQLHLTHVEGRRHLPVLWLRAS